MNIPHFLAALGIATATALSVAHEARPISTVGWVSNTRCLDSENQSKPAINDPATSGSLPQANWLQSPAAEDLSPGFELAAQLSLHTFCLAVGSQAGARERLEAASKAIERTLDAHHIEIAAQIFMRASELVPEIPQSQQPTLLHFELARARLLSFQDKDREALELRLSLREPLADTFGAYSTEATENKVRICDLMLEEGAIDSALLELDQLQNYLSRHPMTSVRAELLAKRAFASGLAMKGREDEALNVLQQLLVNVESRFGNESDWAIDAEQSQSEIFTRVGRIDEALEKAAKVFVIRQANARSNQFGRVRSLWHLAYLYFENSRYATAKEITKSLLNEIRTNSERLEQRLYAHTLSLDADLDEIVGDSYSEVEKRKEVFLSEMSAHGQNSPDTQIEGINYAITLKKVGRVKEGCDLLGAILDRLDAVNSQDVWSYEYARGSFLTCQLAQAHGLEADRVLARMHDSWVRVAAHDGSTSSASLAALGSLANAYLAAGQTVHGKFTLGLLVNLAEEARQRSAEGSMARDSIARWIAESKSAGISVAGYRMLALLHAQDNELESALRVSELARDRSLGDRFMEQEWRRAQLPASQREELDRAADRIQDFDERIAAASDIVERVRLESERTLAVGERSRAERRVRESLHLPAPTFRPPTLDDLRGGLPPDTALASILHSGETWWALVIRRDAPARYVAFADPDLGRNAAAWARRLRGDPVRAWPASGRLIVQFTRPDGATGPYLGTDELGHRLSRNLVEPLARALGTERHLVIVADDELIGIPIQALPFGPGLVLDRFEVSYAPSLATYAHWQAPQRRIAHPRDFLGIAAGDFGRPLPAQTDDAVMLGLEHASRHPLPFAEAEIAGIATLFPAQRTESWTGASASKANLRRASGAGELTQFRFVHFATHAWAQPDQPESSAVALGTAAGGTPAQGVLTAAELAGLRMGADLIVLSACDTGLGRYEYGRGLLGLAYASLAAGNRAALLSLWPVADETTAGFMQGFYERLVAGHAPPAALAETQREFRRSPDPRRSDPLVWAAFVIYGGY